mgnify:CR=1 FL=1
MLIHQVPGWWSPPFDIIEGVIDLFKEEYVFGAVRTIEVKPPQTTPDYVIVPYGYYYLGMKKILIGTYSESDIRRLGEEFCKFGLAFTLGHEIGHALMDSYQNIRELYHRIWGELIRDERIAIIDEDLCDAIGLLVLQKLNCPKEIFWKIAGQQSKSSIIIKERFGEEISRIIFQ